MSTYKEFDFVSINMHCSTHKLHTLRQEYQVESKQSPFPPQEAFNVEGPVQFFFFFFSDLDFKALETFLFGQAGQRAFVPANQPETKLIC